MHRSEQGLTEKQSYKLPRDKLEEVSQQLADVRIYLVHIADKLQMNLLAAPVIAIDAYAPEDFEASQCDQAASHFAYLLRYTTSNYFRPENAALFVQYKIWRLLKEAYQIFN